MGELSFVDSFIKESSKLVVDVKHAAHQIVCNLAKLTLRWSDGFDGPMDWHGLSLIGKGCCYGSLLDGHEQNYLS